jgi:hypothetical protein
MESNFHSTVLQRPQSQGGSGGGDDERDRDRLLRRDLVNAGSADQAQVLRHSSSSTLGPRSPTRTSSTSANTNAGAEFHHNRNPPAPPPPSLSPGQHTHLRQHHDPRLRQSTPPRSLLHGPAHPYLSPSSQPQQHQHQHPSSASTGGLGASAMAPPGLAAPQASPTSTSPSSNAGHHHHHQGPPGPSPLHPPTGYYPPPAASDAQQGRDTTKSSYYDPTKETTKSDSWRANARDSTTPKVSRHYPSSSIVLFFHPSPCHCRHYRL